MRCCQAISRATDFSAQRKVSLRQISDSPVARRRATIVPGKRGANEMWPAARAVKSVMNRLPPLRLRLMPANSPPPVCVFMAIVSDIHAMQLVWL